MNKTKEQARGKWRGILMHFGVDENFLRDVHGPCPVCGGRDRFRFDDKDGEGTFYCSQCGPGTGIDLLMRFKGWDFATAAKEADSIVGNVEPVKPKPKRDKRPMLRKIRERLGPMRGEVADYLLGRKLPVHLARYLKQAKLNYFDKETNRSLGEFHCMVGEIVSPSGKLVGYHLTHLESGKKADVPSPKKTMALEGRLHGSCVRLTKVCSHIGITEGIESAIAVMGLFNIPCWSALNTSVLERWVPPEGVSSVTIYADNDKNFAGQKSAYCLANKLSLKGLDVSVVVPEKPGTDFADVLVAND